MEDVNEVPFLSIVTRCFKRPNALALNRASVHAQRDQDFEQLFIVDSQGLGLLIANQSLYDNRGEVRGRYVFILDDDDYLIRTDFIGKMRQIVDTHDPDVIVIKMISVNGKIIPTEDTWGKKPIFCKIGTSCVVVRNKVWKRHIDAFGKPSAGDFSFIKELFSKRNNYRIRWVNLLASKVQYHGKGKPEK